MRAVLHTNILVSAFVFPGGAPEMVYRGALEGRYELVVDVYVTGTTAEVNEDFTWSGPKVVSFARNRTTASFTVPILIDGDEGAEPNEKIVFELSAPSTGYSLVSGPTARAFVTITDFPVPPVPTLSAPVVNGPTSIAVVEHPSGLPHRFRVELRRLHVHRRRQQLGRGHAGS